MAFTEIGYTGTSTNNTDYTGYSAPITFASDQVLNAYGVRWSDTGDKLKIGITDGTSWFSQGEISSTVNGWNDITLPSPITLSAGTYYVAFVPDSLSAVYSAAGSGWSYNNNTNYKSTNYSAAFNVTSQGTPIIKAAASQYQNVRYDVGDAPSDSTVTIPPPVAMVNI